MYQLQYPLTETSSDIITNLKGYETENFFFLKSAHNRLHELKNGVLFKNKCEIESIIPEFITFEAIDKQETSNEINYSDKNHIIVSEHFTSTEEYCQLKAFLYWTNIALYKELGKHHQPFVGIDKYGYFLTIYIDDVISLNDKILNLFQLVELKFNQTCLLTNNQTNYYDILNKYDTLTGKQIKEAAENIYYKYFKDKPLLYLGSC